MGFEGQAGYYADWELAQEQTLGSNQTNWVFLTTTPSLLTHRYYDASTGRFVNRDPIGYQGGANLYGYCGGNPVNETDPNGTSGLSSLWHSFCRWWCGSYHATDPSIGTNRTDKSDVADVYTGIAAPIVQHPIQSMQTFRTGAGVAVFTMVISIAGGVGGPEGSEVGAVASSARQADPLVPEIVARLEAAYPELKGQIKTGEEYPGYGDYDIELPYAVVQVKDTLKSSGLTKQVQVTMAREAKIGLNRPVIGYRPKMGMQGMKAINNAGGIGKPGGIGTNSIDDLIAVLAPPK